MAEMCELLFSDTSKFLAEFHASRGDEEASQTPWSQLPQLGRVRELKFITAIKVGIVPHTLRGGHAVGASLGTSCIPVKPAVHALLLQLCILIPKLL